MSIATPSGHSAQDAVYSVPDGQLASGSTLGSPKLTVTLKPTGAINSIYSVDLGKQIFGSVSLRHFDERSGMHLAPLPGAQFLIHAERQEYCYQLAGGLDVRESVVVLSEDPARTADQLPATYVDVEIHNQGPDAQDIATFALAEAFAGPSDVVHAAYEAQPGVMTLWTERCPEHVSAFGCSVSPQSFALTQDQALGVAQHHPGRLPNTTPPAQRPLAVLQVAHHLAPGQSARFHYVLTCSAHGRTGALEAYRACPDAAGALARTAAYYATALRRSMLLTPNADVNRGVLWAKANMLRTELHPPSGWAFTNTPGASNNCVARDSAWFAFGADYMTPAFARECLLQFVRRQKPNGLIVEFYNMLTGETDDYGFNINDNTPLLLIALWHHYTVTGDDDFLHEVYPCAIKAARHIVAQENDQGLVWCSATGTGEHGIVGWRNVMSDGRLSGATTEVNSECFAALQAVARMAAILGQQDDHAYCSAQAEALGQAIHHHLYNERNDLYYLNIDEHGVPHSDVTTDLVFPVMFGVATGRNAVHIISRLNDRDFWTLAGLRTVPRDAPTYSPTGNYGLTGGVWVAVTFWYAFAAARHTPEFIDRALGDSFMFYSTQPQRYNTVPGQFSEWLHGETLANQGMMLSPWFPPRYLWAAIEGAAGLEVGDQEARITPRLAPEWKWLALRNLPYHGHAISWLIARVPEIHLYTTGHVRSSSPSVACTAGDEDISDQIECSHDTICIFGLRAGDQLICFVGSTDDQSTVVRVRLKGELRGTYHLRTYHSVAREWQDNGSIKAEKLRDGLVVEIERKGFRLLDLRPMS